MLVLIASSIIRSRALKKNRKYCNENKEMNSEEWKTTKIVARKTVLFFVIIIFFFFSCARWSIRWWPKTRCYLTLIPSTRMRLLLFDWSISHLIELLLLSRSTFTRCARLPFDNWTWVKLEISSLSNHRWTLDVRLPVCVCVLLCMLVARTRFQIQPIVVQLLRCGSIIGGRTHTEWDRLHMVCIFKLHINCKKTVRNTHSHMFIVLSSFAAANFKRLAAAATLAREPKHLAHRLEN